MALEKLASFIGKYDQKRDAFFSKKWHYLITLPLLFILLIYIYLLFCAREGTYDTVIFTRLYGVKSEGALVAFRVLSGIAFGLAIATLVLRGITKHLSGRDFARILVFSSCLGLLLFGFTNSLNEYGWHHDASKLGRGNHWSIIYDIYSTGQIPPVALNNQYYQPKVYHFIVAIWMKVVKIFIPGGETLVDPNTTVYTAYTIAAYQAFDSSRILMAFIGMLPIIITPRIFSYLGMKGAPHAIATGIAVLIPQTWFIHFYMNNDGMSYAFGVFAFYFALRYRKTKDFLTVILIALSLGLSMAIKLNGGFLAVPIALVFLYILLERIRDIKAKDPTAKKALGRFLIQVAIFAVIVFPLGLFVPFYHLIKYKEPIGYVLDLGTTGGMYIDPEFYNPFQRYFPYVSGDYFFSIFNHRWRGKVNNQYVNVYGVIDFNCWAAFNKTLLFGEQDLTRNIHNISLGLSGIAYFIVILIFFVFMYGWIFLLVKAIRNKTWKENLESNLIVAALAITYLVDYVLFCHKYPVGCTQNSRYVLYLIFAMGYVNGRFFDGLRSLRKPKNPVEPEQKQEIIKESEA